MADSNEPVPKVTNNQEAEAQNILRMAEIQSCLDSSGLEKIPESPITLEYRNLDLIKHRLVYDGPLTMKLGDPNRFKTTDLHVFLFENFYTSFVFSFLCYVCSTCCRYFSPSCFPFLLILSGNKLEKEMVYLDGQL